MVLSASVIESDAGPFGQAPKEIHVNFEQNNEGPQWLREVLARLNEIASLGDDWDSYGAVGLSVDAAATCIRLLAYLGGKFELPEIRPLPSGGLTLEWHTTTHEVDIEVDSSGRVSLLIESADGGVVEAHVVGSTISKMLTEYFVLLLNRLPRPSS